MLQIALCTLYGLFAISIEAAPRTFDLDGQNPSDLARRAGNLCVQAKALSTFLASRSQPLPPTINARLLKAAAQGHAKEADAILSGLSLLEIHINPESRVKVARGSARAELKVGENSLLLVRISNEAGVTGPLTCTIPQRSVLPGAEAIPVAGWLKVRVISILGTASEQRLNGTPIEYALLSLSTQEAGLREATLSFDVGQGTQDLGFRGELPVLFRCIPTRSK